MLTAAAGLLTGYLLGLAAAARLLTVRTPLYTADILIVVGGDDAPRTAQAISLYFRRIAPLVLVSGRGDCTIIRHAMIAAGVPSNAIEIECASETTWENAAYSAPILRQFAVRRAVLVTSWYHSRRALACFRASAPWIDWMSAPTPVGWWPALVGTTQGGGIVEEYLKIAWYVVRHGISPVGLTKHSAATTIEGPPWTYS